GNAAAPTTSAAEEVHEVDLSDEWASMLDETQPAEEASKTAREPHVEAPPEVSISEEPATEPAAHGAAHAEFEVPVETPAVEEGLKAQEPAMEVPEEIRKDRKAS